MAHRADHCEYTCTVGHCEYICTVGMWPIVLVIVSTHALLEYTCTVGMWPIVLVIVDTFQGIKKN